MEAPLAPVKRKWNSLSLFWKIWVACMLSLMMSLFSLLAVTLITRSNMALQTWTELSGNALYYLGQSGVAAYETHGEPALRTLLNDASRRTHLNLWLLDENHRPLFGVEPDTRVLGLETKSRTVDSYASLLNLDGARRIVGKGGRNYIIIGVAQDALTSRPTVFFLRGFLFFGFPALFAFLLARHVSSPIVSLRKAVNQVAQGDLSIKVGSRIGKRNDEIEDLAHDFDKMTEQISALLSAQRRLLGDISHELRSPLARLTVALAIAQERASSEAQTPLNRIGKEAERMNEMIGQLLTLTRLETDSGAATEVAIFDLEALAQEVVGDADFEAKGLNRSVALLESAPCRLNGNRELLRSSIENVLRNAVKYTPEGTEVEVRLQLSEQANGRMATVQVRDRGNGVPEEALDQLFRPFYRVAEDRSRRTGGTGLGLAITERAIHFHGGTVHAENAPGGGLQITLHIPLSDGT